MSLRPSYPPAAPGFTLVEVALSMAILSVGMVGVLSLLPVGLDSARQVHSETLAASVARSAISEFLITNRAVQVPPSSGKIYYTADGVKTTATNLAGSQPTNRPYFQVDFTSIRNSSNSWRTFFTLAWPVAALGSGQTNPNIVQQRTFLVDLTR